jgi:NADPH-dependent 2,4-dienoyl-CoA reductase/sulfur reductase-like enzyme
VRCAVNRQASANEARARKFFGAAPLLIDGIEPYLRGGVSLFLGMLVAHGGAMRSNAPRDAHTQVLVVGAGPAGLLAALRLTRLGIRVRLVEQQAEPRAHSFPVLLHTRSLELLLEAGVSAALFWRGRPVTRLAVYTDHERRAVLDFPELPGLGAGLLTLPQDILRQALTNALEQAGVRVEWNTRLVTLQ